MLETVKNVVYDTKYAPTAAPTASVAPATPVPVLPKKKAKVDFSFIDKFFSGIFPSLAPKKKEDVVPGGKNAPAPENEIIKDKELRDQVKYLLELPDDQYDDKKLTSKLRQYIMETEKEYNTVIANYKSHIAPSYREFTPTRYNISGLFGKSYYAQSYPSYIDALRTRDILGFHAKRDMSRFIYPEDDSAIQTMLKNRVTQLRAEIKDAAQKGITMDVEVEQQYRDVEMIREKLTTREERYFESSLYINLYEENEEKLKEEGKRLEQKISGYGIRLKNAIQRMDEGFNSGLPMCVDDL
jgi:hypothetical protein